MVNEELRLDSDLCCMWLGHVGGGGKNSGGRKVEELRGSGRGIAEQ